MFNKITKFSLNPLMFFALIGSLFHFNKVKHISKRKLRIRSRIYTPPSLGLPSNWSNTQKVAIVGALIATIIGSLIGASLVTGNVSSTQPIGAYSYMIYQDPSFTSNGLYDAKAANGTICWTSTNFTTVAQNVINTCNNKGVIQLLANTTYLLDGALSIVGDNSGQASGISILGGGFSTVIQQTEANSDGIDISNGATVILKNFKLLMPNTNSGNGINGLDTGADTKVSISNSVFDQIFIQGCDTNHTGMYIRNPATATFGYIWVSSSGNCVVFDETMTGYNSGNCVFDHLVGYSSLTTGYVLTIQALVASSNINLMTFNHIDADTLGGAIHLEAKNGGTVETNNFMGLDLESQKKQIFIDVDGDSAINGNYFQADYMSVNAGQIAIDASVSNSNQGGNRYEITVQNDGSSTILNDGSTGYTIPNVYDFNLMGTRLTSSQIVLATQPFDKVTWITSWADRNPNSGATSVADGGTITHQLDVTPTWITVSGSIAGTIATVTAKSATTFTVSLKFGNGTAAPTQTVYWQAGWNND
jgi:hypothetical protein